MFYFCFVLAAFTLLKVKIVISVACHSGNFNFLLGGKNTMFVILIFCMFHRVATVRGKSGK